MEETLLELRLSVQDPDMVASRLDMLTREITVGLNRERGLEAHVPEDATQVGMRGDPVALGAIVLQLLGSGGAIAVLLNGLKGYFLRKQSLMIDVKRPDGMKFTLKAENVSEQQLSRTTSELLDFLKDGAS